MRGRTVWSDRRGATNLDQHAFLQPDHTIHLRGEAFIMGCHQRCAALAPNQREELGEDGIGGVFGDGIAHHLLGFLHERVQVVEQFLGRLGGSGDGIVFHGRG